MARAVVLGALRRAGLRGLAKVAMVQAANLWTLHDLAGQGGPALISLSTRTHPTSGPSSTVIVVKIAGQDAA
jgi:hypothetical protein